MTHYQPSMELQNLKNWRDRLLYVFLVSLFSSFAVPFTAPFTLIVSLLSFLCLFVTTILAWRKDARERKSFDLDNTKKELEIEKLKIEIGKAKEEKKLIVEG